MKKFKTEIQIIVLMIGIVVAVVFSGNLVYQSLSGIVRSIHQEARPDLKLLLIKDIASNLNEIENTIRLFSLSGDNAFLRPQKKLNAAIQEQLTALNEYAIPGSTDKIHIDSIQLLAKRKILVWNALRQLYQSKGDAHQSFTKLYTKIDSTIIQPDTIKFVKEERKSFFKRVFGKRDTTTRRPVIIDKSKEKEIIKQEIAGIEKQLTDQSLQFKTREKILLKQNIQVTEVLNKQILRLETSEQNRLEVKILEADAMAEKTYKRLAIFIITAVLLLIIALFLIIRNIQKNQLVQQALKKARTEAENLARAKEIFVATVSHEMRTPVNAIFGLTEQMLQKAIPNESKSDLEIVHKSAKHLITLVNDTLDFSKIEAQKLKIEQIDFLPDEIVQEVFTLHQYSAQTKGIELKIINQTDKNLVLKGDAVRLKQILINLITNAIKFTKKGSITLQISSETSSEENCLLKLEVSDTGIGISKADQTKIFEEFVQLDTDLTQKQRGTGLGLAIVKKLTDLQNGKIEVESIPGKGTRFIIRIPYLKGNPDGIPTKPEIQLKIPVSFSRLNFLIVDDEEYNRYLMKNILNKWGVQFTEAHNGQEAVELVLKNQFDLILMDIRMPVMNGYEAAMQIRNERPESKIIALTATNKPDEEQKNNRSGIHTFLQKPFSEQALFDAVLNLLPLENNIPEHENSPAVDLEELEKMTDGDPVFFAEMVRIFIRSSENGLAAIQENFQSGNRIGMVEAAHKLAAPAKHMHATNLYANLKKLENESESIDDMQEIKQLIDQIEKEIGQINRFLNEKLDEK